MEDGGSNGPPPPPPGAIQITQAQSEAIQRVIKS